MPDRTTIKRQLSDPDPESARRLYAEADMVRKNHVGDAVYLRGLIEISNHCRRLCAYCGVNASRRLTRYRLSREEIVVAAHMAKQYGYGTVVLQAGEDALLDKEFISAVVTDIKAATGLAVTLSLGEREPGEYAAWKQAGADRYLLRFETSDPELFARIHPPPPGAEGSSRIHHLQTLRELGYEIGSGVMVGIPGQTWDSLANDIALFHEMDLDMIGIGPYIRHPDTEMGCHPERFPPAAPGEQVPADEETTCRAVALARLVQPYANIPATTALSLVNRESGRSHGLARGANIIMPNITPLACRRLYEIYPAKSLSIETAEEVNKQITAQLQQLGRHLGVGAGDSLNRSR